MENTQITAEHKSNRRVDAPRNDLQLFLLEDNSYQAFWEIENVGSAL